MALIFVLESGYSWNEVAEETLTAAKLNQMFDEGRVVSISGTLEAGNYGQESIVLNDIAKNILEGSRVANVADDNTTGGIALIHRIDVAASTTASYDVTFDHKTRIIRAWVQVNGSTGSSGDQLQLKTTSGASNISNILSLNNQPAPSHIFEIPFSGGSTANYSVQNNGEDGEIIDAWIRLEGAGTASDTLQLKLGANAITEALDISAMADHTVSRFATIIDAYHNVTNGSSITLAQVDGGSSDCPAGSAYIQLIRDPSSTNNKYILDFDIENAYHEISASSDLRVQATHTTGLPACTVYILGVRVA